MSAPPGPELIIPEIRRHRSLQQNPKKPVGLGLHLVEAEASAEDGEGRRFCLARNVGSCRQGKIVAMSRCRPRVMGLKPPQNRGDAQAKGLFAADRI